MTIWQTFKRLFAPAKQIPPPLNRSDRRTRQSIARRQRSLAPKETRPSPNTDTTRSK